MLSARERSGSQGPLPDWMPWLQAGLTAMLAVLFLVLMTRSREQSTELRELKERVQGLENTRALERTTALEEQLRSTVERLHEVERRAAQQTALNSENAQLRRELQQQRHAAAEATPPTAGLEGQPLPLPQGLPSLPPIKP